MEYYSNITDRAWLEVDLAALRHNLEVAQATGKKVMAVIKGNALGTGAPRIGMELEKHGCDAFGVACLDEAIELRSVVTRPILILGYTPASFAAELVKFDITQTVVDLEHAKELHAAAEILGVCVNVHIKLDTGMSRFGIMAQGEKSYQTAALEVSEIFHLKNLHVQGIFTHFAMADIPDRNPYTAWQLNNFNAVVDEVRRLGIDQPFICHVSNSAGILFHPEARFDMVRAGAMLFGVNPRGVPMASDQLEQIMSLKARVYQVRNFPPGTHVSYGGLYTTTRETQIAVIPVGFGDGYNRSWTGKGMYAVIRGHRCPQVGRICMDTTMFDVTGANVRRGDIAILYGRGGPAMDEIAQMCGTNNMEPVILLTKRVRFQYVDSASSAIQNQAQ